MKAPTAFVDLLSYRLKSTILFLFKRLAVLLLGVLITPLSYAQLVKYSTRKPQWGEEITVTIKPKLASLSPSYAMVELDVDLENGGRYRLSLPMKPEGDAFTATWTVAEGVSIFMPTFYLDGREWDLDPNVFRQLVKTTVYRSPGVQAHYTERFDILIDGRVERELKHHPTNFVAYFYRWVHLKYMAEMNSDERAMNRVDKIIQREWEELEQGGPVNEGYWVAKVAANSLLGSTTEALAAFESLLQQYPQTEWVAEAMEALDYGDDEDSEEKLDPWAFEDEEIISAIEGYLHNYPESTFGMKLGVSLWAEENTFSKPEEMAMVARKAQPTNPEDRFNKMLILGASVKDRQERILYLDSAAQAGFNHAYVQYGTINEQGWGLLAEHWRDVSTGYLQEEAYKKAEYVLTEVLRNFPDHQEKVINQNMAKLREQQGRYEEARLQWFDAFVRNDTGAMKEAQRVHDTYLAHTGTFSQAKVNYALPVLGPNPPKQLQPFVLQTAQGRQISHEDFEGDILIAVFVSDQCSSCPETLQTLEDLYQKYRDLGVEVVTFFEFESYATPRGYGMDQYSYPAVPAAFEVFDEYEIGYDEFNNDYRTDFLPTYIIFDREGWHLYGFRERGFLDAKDLELLVEKALEAY
ncbi:MAG TPA: hypothetical protein DCE41_12840 [Cytophagales bacterium]|nr:hypothetical protein [Cytophagales bacterium]HAP64057.1 hypothetical protein [Cytophagales bacterium]